MLVKKIAKYFTKFMENGTKILSLCWYKKKKNWKNAYDVIKKFVEIGIEKLGVNFKTLYGNINLTFNSSFPLTL